MDDGVDVQQARLSANAARLRQIIRGSPRELPAFLVEKLCGSGSGIFFPEDVILKAESAGP